jgi:hypothetical protein
VPFIKTLILFYFSGFLIVANTTKQLLWWGWGATKMHYGKINGVGCCQPKGGASVENYNVDSCLKLTLAKIFIMTLAT